MKNRIAFFAASLVIVLSAYSYGTDNVYFAGGSTVDSGASHTPAALKSSDDGTAQLLSIGEVETQITPTLVVTATTYPLGYVVGGKLTFSGVARENSGSVSLKSVLLIDANSTVNKQPMQLILFDTPTLTGTYTDHAAFAVNASDATHIIRSIPIAAADYTQAATGLAIADITQASRALQLSGTTSISGLLLVTSGTATMSGTNTMILRIGVKQN